MRYEESSTVELKRQMVDDLDKEIIAFLNTRGGTIYIGVEDDGTPIGVPQDLKDKYDLAVSNILTDSIRPNPTNLVEYHYDQDNILVINIQEGTLKPYFLTTKGAITGGTYIRVGRSKRPADREEIVRLAMESRNYSFEKEISEDQNLTFKYMSLIADEKGLEFNSQKYKALKLADEQGRFTNLGLLVSDQNPIVLKFAVYDRNMHFLIKKDMEGSLIKIADLALYFSDLTNTTSAKIIPGQISRVEQISYPGASLREAVLNAICHADYTIHSNIKIEFFPDRARVINPGAVFDSTLDAAMSGVLSYRNPWLVNIFSKLGYIKSDGTGLAKIKEAYENTDFKPEFKEISHFFIVTLPNLNWEFYKEAAEEIERSTRSRVVSRGYTNFSPDTQNNDKSDTQKPVQTTSVGGKNASINKGNSSSNIQSDGIGGNTQKTDTQNGGKNSENKIHRHRINRSDLISWIKAEIADNSSITKEELAYSLSVSKATITRAIRSSGDIEHIGPSKGGVWIILKNRRTKKD